MGRMPEGKAEKMFKKIGKNVDSYVSDIKESKKFAYLNIEKRISELTKNKDSIEQQFSDASKTAKSQWEYAKPNLERAGQELRKAIHVMFSKQAYR